MFFIRPIENPKAQRSPHRPWSPFHSEIVEKKRGKISANLKLQRGYSIERIAEEAKKEAKEDPKKVIKMKIEPPSFKKSSKEKMLSFFKKKKKETSNEKDENKGTKRRSSLFGWLRKKKKEGSDSQEAALAENESKKEEKGGMDTELEEAKGENVEKETKEESEEKSLVVYNKKEIDRTSNIDLSKLEIGKGAIKRTEFCELVERVIRTNMVFEKYRDDVLSILTGEGEENVKWCVFPTGLAMLILNCCFGDCAVNKSEKIDDKVDPEVSFSFSLSPSSVCWCFL